jgi:DNA-binding MarR family transcriptional regulator
MAFAKIELTGTGSCAAFNLRRTSRVVTALYDSALAASGLSSPQVTILIGVAKSEPVPVGVLANILLADHTTLTRNLALLSRKGLVRVSARSTMRRRLVSLTAKGNTALARSVRRWRKIQTDFVGSFGELRWKEMQKALEELASIAVHLKSR